ncbi:unnamed protein product, partial [Ectocarpus sp. 12 AP-2014]
LPDENPTVFQSPPSTATLHLLHSCVPSCQRPGSGEVKLSSFQDTVEATLMFVESYLMMHRRNEVCFVACTARESTIIFPTPAME